MRNKSLLDNIKNYKDTLIGSEHSLFDGKMFCKVSGVTFDGRQKNLISVNKETLIRLVRDRHNKFDFYAVIVQAFVEDKWKEVGFIPSNMNKPIAQTIDKGVKLSAKVWKKSGGGEKNYPYGLTITINRD